VAADQATKSWAVARLSHGPIHVVGPLELELQFNTGSAFSLFTGFAPVLAGVAVVLVALLAGSLRRATTLAQGVAVGLVGGGAIGNLSDRLFRHHHGAVVDFIALRFWPTFNVADACIVVGCVLLVVGIAHRARQR